MARRRPTAAPREAPRSGRLRAAAGGLAAAALLALPASATLAAPPAPTPDPPRFNAYVSDALRAPAHRLAASQASGRAAANLVFSDATGARTSVRACVRRRDVEGVGSCFTVTTGAPGVATVTPLRFPRGSWVARWKVAGELVASWTFRVV